MKKSLLVLALSIFMITQSMAGIKGIQKNLSILSNISSYPKSGSGGDKEMTGGGFYALFGVSSMSKNYYVPKAIDNDSGETFGIGTGFELGTYFRIAHIGEQAFGLKATWFSAVYTKMALNDSTNVGIAQASMKLGPYFTTEIADKMALDAYYQIAPTFGIEVYDGSLTVFGLTHTLGVAYRYGVLQLGLDYNFGAVRDMDSLGEEVPPELEEFFKFRTSHLRLYIGVRI